MAYISRKPCGCLVMASVDDPKHADATAREVAKAIRQGEKVERVTVEFVREMRWRCDDHSKAAPAQKQAALL